MENFDLLALNWDNEPRRVERANVVANEIMAAIPNLDEMVGFEYGCGTGLLSFNLHSHMKRIVLGDSSDGMLAALRQKLLQYDISNMEPVKIDLTIDSLPHEEYDIIYTLMTLHHIVDIDMVLKAFYESLKPSGYLCIADLDEEDGSFHGEGFTGYNGFNRVELSNKLKQFEFHSINSKICYEVVRTTENGQDRRYPVFIMTAQK